MLFRSHIFQPALNRTGPFGQYDLDRGHLVVESDDDLDTYIVAYGPLHFHKIVDALRRFPFEEAARYPLEIIDWGCGAGINSWVFCRMLLNIESDFSAIRRLTLVDASKVALRRAFQYHYALAHSAETQLIPTLTVHRELNLLQPSDFTSQREYTKIHLVCNVLDVPSINVSTFQRLIAASFSGANLFIALGPRNTGQVIDRFEALWENNAAFSRNRHVTNSIEGWAYHVTRQAVVERKSITRYERQFSCII